MENKKEMGWVIIIGDKVTYYSSWDEASNVNKIIGGYLMSKRYYDNYYKKEN